MYNNCSVINEIVDEICAEFSFHCVDDDRKCILIQNDKTGEVLLLSKEFNYDSDIVKRLYTEIDKNAVDKESAANAKKAYQMAICQSLENHYTKEIMLLFGVIM